MALLPTGYIPHGGGPCFFMAWDPPDAWDSMALWLKSWALSFPIKPSAIVVVSAHWEEDVFTVTSAAAPALIYDYYGFPPETYKITYPALGSPLLASRVQELLGHAGIANNANPTRGFDHGVFIPFKLIYPEADIPILQLSLKTGLDPLEHWNAGEALRKLREDNVLIVGSGMSYHNLQGFFHATPAAHEASIVFDQWLEKALSTPMARQQNLMEWTKAPHARDVHPREDHLLPLMVVAGAAAGDPAHKIYGDQVMGKAVSAFQFG